MRFKSATGKSILEEIIDMRFEKLLVLLEKRHLALGTLAGQTGFTSENQLQRQFKARFGMTLSAYRKSRVAVQHRPRHEQVPAPVQARTDAVEPESPVSSPPRP